MRRIKNFGRGEADRGATAILIAFLMTGLLGFAGLAIDLGASYAKHTELQNGADAAALALAQEFAFEDNPCGAARDSGEAKGWVELNVLNDETAAQGLVQCEDVDPNLEENQLRVVADARLNHWFMPVVGKQFSDLSADATVEFGVPGTLITSPVALAECALPEDVEELEEETEIVVWFPHPSGDLTQDTDVCGWHEKYPAGGFSVIQPDEKGSCDVTIKLPVELPSAPAQSEVNDLCMEPLIGEVNFVPVFDDSKGQGAGGIYEIIYFAAIRIDFIGFASDSYGDKELGCPDDRPAWTHKSQDLCLRGAFMGLVSIEDVVGDDLTAPGPEDTAVVVRLID